MFRELQSRGTTIDTLYPDFRMIHTKIMSVFYHLAQVRKFIEELFCTSKISNLIEAHSTYNKYCKKKTFTKICLKIGFCIRWIN